MFAICVSLEAVAWCLRAGVCGRKNLRVLVLQMVCQAYWYWGVLAGN
jgi:hypothetical protein